MRKNKSFVLALMAPVGILGSLWYFAGLKALLIVVGAIILLTLLATLAIFAKAQSVKRTSPGTTTPSSDEERLKKRKFRARLLIGLILLITITSIVWFGDLSDLGFGGWVAFTFFVLAIYGLLIHIYENESEGEVGKFIANKVILAILLLIVLNSVFRLKLRFVWDWLYGDAVLFIILNFLVIAAIFLAVKTKEVTEGGTKKRIPDPADKKFVGIVVALAVALVLYPFVERPLAAKIATSRKNNEQEKKVVKILRDSNSPLLAIGECNSGLQHYELDLPERNSPEDWEVKVTRDKRVGIMGIPDSLKEEVWDKLKLDIYKFEDNIKYAKILWKRHGGLYWLDSANCWGPKVGNFDVVVSIPASGRTPVFRWPKDYYFDRITKPEKKLEFFYGYSNGINWQGFDEPGVMLDPPKEIQGSTLQTMWFAPAGEGPSKYTIEVRVR